MSPRTTVSTLASGGRLLAAALALLLPALPAAAAIPGVENTTQIDLIASPGYVLTPDGASIYAWGYGLAGAGGTMQYPGPTLILNQGTTYTVTLTNALPQAAGNVSIVFPGQGEVVATGGVEGLLTREAPPGGTVTYTFAPAAPGTYVYHSGTRPDLQVEMGLSGAIVVRPAAAVACSTPVIGGAAYDHPDTCYDREYLFVLSEIDLEVHRAAEQQAGAGVPIAVSTDPYDPEYWFVNGRCAPDTMSMAGSPLLPHQPYNIVPRMHPGERVLMRVVGAGRQYHPYHHHGNHARILARDGRLIESATTPGALAGPTVFTIGSFPGGTADAIFEWTGKDLGWDAYGHTADDGTSCTDNNGDGFDDAGAFDNLGEYCADHAKPIPVELPSNQVLAFGGFWSGSPYLGFLGSLPPGEGGLNPNAGYTFMWHSHTEREMVNNDVFPGGMMTMLVIEPPSVTIVE